jgi:hypothetical protein
MFGRGNRETEKLLSHILMELQKLNRVWTPAEPTPSETPEAKVEPVGILDRPLGRDSSITLKESLLRTFVKGKSLDSVATGYATFARGDIDHAVSLLVDSGELVSKISRTKVDGVSADRLVYRVASSS